MDREGGEDDDEDFILPHKSITETITGHIFKVKNEPEINQDFQMDVDVVENKIYICTEPSCLAKFSDPIKLKIHRNKHYPKSCRCTICDIGHPDDQSFQNHQKTYHNLQPDGTVLEPLKCNKCAKISKDSKALRRHIIESHRPNKFPCHICSFQFTRPENLKAHLKNIHPSDPSKREEFKCKSCDNSYRDKSTFRSHIREHHRDTGTHNCCNKIFNNIFAYNRHQKYWHVPSSSNISKCKVCGVIIDRRHKSRHDMTKFHQNALKRQNKKDVNVARNTGIKIKKEVKNEDVKPKIQTNSDDSDSNEVDKNLKKMCRLCQKPFKNMKQHKNSEYHLRRSKIEKEKIVQDKEISPVLDPQKISVNFNKDYDYSCKICQMEFTTNGMLKSHLKSASHLKIYNFLNNPVKEESVQVIKLGCSICDMTFKYKSELTTHLTRKYHLGKLKSLNSHKQESMDDSFVITKVQSLTSKPPALKNCYVLVQKLDLNVMTKCIVQNDYGPIIKNIKSNQQPSKQVIKNKGLDLNILPKNPQNSNYEEFRATDDITIKEEDVNYMREEADKSDDDPTDTDGENSDNEISFYCMYCDKPYKSISQVQAHETKCLKLQKLRKTYECSTCYKKFSDKQKFERHTAIHTSPSAPQFKCQFGDCDLQFKTHEYRTLHEKRMHLKSEHKVEDNKPKPRFDCCGKSFVNIKCYKAHIDGVHLKIKHPCPQCNFISAYEKSLRDHIRNKHGKEIYHCKVCDRKFHSEKCMAEHLTRKRHLAMVKGVKYYNRKI